MIKRLIIICIGTFGLISFSFAQEFIRLDSLKKHVTILASDAFEGRGFGFLNKHLAVEYIASAFISAGLKPVNNSYLQSFIHKTAITKIEGNNIIGMVEGSDPVLKDEYIILGAHYDHVGFEMKDGKKVFYNGANDNASGVASIIEIGRYLSANQKQLKRSVIIVAFDAEESGLFGSAAFLSEKIVDPAKIRIMFSLDMVGTYEKNDGLELNGMNSIKEGELLAGKISKEKNVKMRNTANSVEMRTDTWSFAKYNIPSVHVFTGEKQPYHKPEDDSNLIDFDGMIIVNEFICELTKELSNQDQLLADKQFITKSTEPKFRIGISSNMGANKHIYAKEFYVSKPLFSLETGIVTQFRLSKNFSVQPEVAYEMYGGKIETGDLRIHSITPRINLLITTPNKGKGFPFGYLLAGGYYRNNFSGKENGQSADFSAKYSKNEKGICFGAGLQIMKYQIGFYQKNGFDNLYKNIADGEIVNKTNYFSVIYFF
jgi:hypothetical protein